MGRLSDADVLAALWLADSVGSFRSSAGRARFITIRQFSQRRCVPAAAAPAPANFVADEELNIKQYTSQYFASRMINVDWVKHGAGVHRFYPAASDVVDDARNTLVTAYAVSRPDGEWSILLVNKDSSNPHKIKIQFAGQGQTTAMQFAGNVSVTTFGANQYVWHPDGAKSHAVPMGRLLSLRWPPSQTPFSCRGRQSRCARKDSLKFLAIIFRQCAEKFIEQRPQARQSWRILSRSSSRTPTNRPPFCRTAIHRHRVAPSCGIGGPLPETFSRLATT